MTSERSYEDKLLELGLQFLSANPKDLNIGIVRTVQVLLKTESPCGHAAHGMQPISRYDWGSVDNMVMHLVTFQTNLMNEMIATVADYYDNKEAKDIVDKLDMLGNQGVLDALNTILVIHATLGATRMRSQIDAMKYYELIAAVALKFVTELKEEVDEGKEATEAKARGADRHTVFSRARH